MNNPEDLADMVSGNAMKAMTAGDKYVSSTSHGGKSAQFAYPLAGPGRGAGINLEVTIGLAYRAFWVVKNYCRQCICAYLRTWPLDVQMATYWIATPEAIPPYTLGTIQNPCANNCGNSCNAPCTPQ